MVCQWIDISNGIVVLYGISFRIGLYKEIILQFANQARAYIEKQKFWIGKKTLLLMRNAFKRFSVVPVATSEYSLEAFWLLQYYYALQ